MTGLLLLITGLLLLIPELLLPKTGDSALSLRFLLLVEEMGGSSLLSPLSLSGEEK